MVQWHRMPTTQETDGFQVKRPGDVNVKCTLLLMLDHQVPPSCAQLWSSVRLANVFSSRDISCLISSSSSATFPVLFFFAPAPSVQAGPTAGPSAGRAHADTSQHHAGSLALHQEQQAAGLSREGVHQLQPLLQTGSQTDWRLCTEANAYIVHTSAVAIIILKRMMEIILVKLCTFFKIHNFLGACY